MLLLLLACNDDPELNRGTPEIVVSPASADFGEVVVGVAYGELGLYVRNKGYGDLEITSATLTEGSSADFAIATYPEVVEHDEEGILGLTYTPDVEGQDFGSIELETNDELNPLVTVEIEGMGTLPRIDVDPEILYFGVVAPGESSTLTVDIGASGSGTLKVTGVGFSGDESVAYSYVLPDDWAEPYPVSHGFSFPIEVTFTPPDESAYEGALYIETNDPEEPIAEVRLLGNTEDDPTKNTPPVVEILDPDNGEYFMDDAEVGFTGYAFDADEVVTNLLCGWFADGTRADDGAVDVTGTITGSSLLPQGEVDLTLRCYDSDGLMGEDSTRVTVWPHEDPVTYTISGGDSVFDWFSVDDDITISVNGVEIFEDSNHTSDTLAPVEFEASAGDVITIRASDINSCDLYLDPLQLHWGTGESQALNVSQCQSSCPDHACYTGDYNGPWPNVFLEEDYTITIPE